MEIRKSIVSRIAVIYFFLLIFGVVVIFKMISVQQIKNDRWEQIAKNLKDNTVHIEPNRGNICADDGSVLATSVPGYYVRIDLAAEGVKRVYAKESDSLAYYLSNFFKDASRAEYNRRLNSAYKNGNRGFMLTQRKVDYQELQQIKKFPILRRGRFGGGMIIEQENQRVTPLGSLGLRTIGDLNKGAYGGVHGNIGYTGLEGAYEQYLKGKEGISYRENLSGRWVTRIEIEPQDGMDIITTLNVKLQDITESALLRSLEKHSADWGTAILMEVETGEIKAIANLGKENGTYQENYNYALGHAGCYEPGSTFKLISLMAAMEDGLVDTSDVYDTGSGVWKYKDRTIYDSDYRHGGHGKMTVKQIFEKSSNVGVAKIITEVYENNPRNFVDRIYGFGLNKPLGVEIKGEGKPFFKYPGDSDWWGTTLAWMSYGYESKMTPLQILTFYNAVANDGRMVKPRLVREIRDNGVLVKQFNTEVLNPMITTRETVGKGQKLLEGVCEYGTGRSLRNPWFKIAGKTGTAQVSTGQSGYQKGMYLASFAGYFPSDNPEYSLIVTVNNPRVGSYYGGSVAGPVFKEIAERVFAVRNMFEETEEEMPESDEMPVFPAIEKGKSENIVRIAEELNISDISGQPGTMLATARTVDNGLVLDEVEFREGRVPDVRGMGASDAVFVLENAGLKVKIKGAGKVTKQSISPGSGFQRGAYVYLTLD
ncbi:cell division protein FtsI (penicillin-binding protein 3) [Mariniphaga anaerophila]|uniref:Cell division protein FtsI (Penicillin-binding protein 3) n=1 Tax=Mariniphaga anaerophila TaxID=1484053 RepID=A0A1M5AAK5_9BACT|nr:penicillin-binding protein [Mariniphaga anaerophila]SHF27117.1 cell division protein FtsI (penicillin-binding protein 3) [Mariniphaga anaerophila]